MEGDSADSMEVAGPNPAVQRSRQLSASGDHEGALGLLAPILEGQPENPEALLCKAEVLDRMGRYQEAEDLYRRLQVAMAASGGASWEEPGQGGGASEMPENRRTPAIDLGPGGSPPEPSCGQVACPGPEGPAGPSLPFGPQPSEGFLRALFEAPTQQYVQDGVLVLDLDTKLESWLTVPSIGFFLLGAFLLAMGHDPTWVALIPILMAFLGLTLACFTENYFLLDPHRQALFYRRKVLFSERITQVASFSEIVAVTMETRRERARHRSWFAHRVLVALKSRKLVTVSDSFIDDPEGAEHLARRVAESLGVPMVPGAHRGPPKVLSGPAPGEFKIWFPLPPPGGGPRRPPAN